jgi:hypothetical protein
MIFDAIQIATPEPHPWDSLTTNDPDINPVQWHVIYNFPLVENTNGPIGARGKLTNVVAGGSNGCGHRGITGAGEFGRKLSDSEPCFFPIPELQT